MARHPCSPPPYQAETHLAATHVLLCITGELDLATAPCLQRDLRQALAAAATAGQRLVLDLDKVRFCDLSGLYALHAAARTAATAGQPIFLTASVTSTDTGHRSSVRRLIELLNQAGCPLTPTLPPSAAAAAT